jgi:alpha-L-arabinofuranosidase
LVLSFVNPRHDADLEVDCALRGVTPAQATAQILQDPDWNAFNAFDNPQRVVPRALPVRLDGPRLRFNLPRLAVATARLRLP